MWAGGFCFVRGLSKQPGRTTIRRAVLCAAIIDSQSVKTTETKGVRGYYDSNKKVKGRKRHILVDVRGMLLAVLVHKASIQERAGAKTLLQRVKQKGFARLALIYAAMVRLMLRRLARHPATALWNS